MLTRRETYPEPHSLEVTASAPLASVLDVGRLAIVHSPDEIAHKVETPAERAQGRIEHLENVFEGRESVFRVYFVLEVDEHAEMHRHFLSLLGLPDATTADLSAAPTPTAVITRNGISLVRTSNLYQTGEAFDVRYETQPAEEVAALTVVTENLAG